MLQYGLYVEQWNIQENTETEKDILKFTTINEMEREIERERCAFSLDFYWQGQGRENTCRSGSAQNYNCCKQ